jgi:hypothetical protein
MGYCNANLYSNTPVLQNSILFNPDNPVKFLKSPTHLILFQI